MYIIIGLMTIVVLLLIIIFTGKTKNTDNAEALVSLKDELNKYQGNVTGRLETMLLQSNQVTETLIS